VLDNGRRIELGAVTVLGRDPGSNEVTETVVAISDPTRSLSRTHLRIGRDETGLWLQDTISANGTGYRTGDGHTVELVPGRRVHVAPGTVVLLGDRSLTLHSEG
jgi:predicted component of type VI protein secretion system